MPDPWTVLLVPMDQMVVQVAQVVLALTVSQPRHN